MHKNQHMINVMLPTILVEYDNGNNSGPEIFKPP